MRGSKLIWTAGSEAIGGQLAVDWQHDDQAINDRDSRCI